RHLGAPRKRHCLPARSFHESHRQKPVQTISASRGRSARQRRRVSPKRRETPSRQFCEADRCSCAGRNALRNKLLQRHRWINTTTGAERTLQQEHRRLHHRQGSKCAFFVSNGLQGLSGSWVVVTLEIRRTVVPFRCPGLSGSTR